MAKPHLSLQKKFIKLSVIDKMLETGDAELRPAFEFIIAYIAL